MIEFKNVSKVYGDGTKAVDDVTFTINEGEFVVLIGTSGSGKTTTMRMINRMIDSTSGEILIDGKDIKQEDAVQLRRKIGYVIQQTGLMPHMTVYENIVMVPKLLKWDKEKMQETAERLLKRVDMGPEFLDRYPQELSGGQQQRIGVIRALAANQDIILMDEPFGALDPITRDALQELVKHLQEEMGRTVVFVTHDMDEALKLADKIAIMSEGKIIQYDTPDNILAEPANEFVESFLGEDRLQQRSTMQTVDQVMVKTPISVTQDITLGEAIRVMRDRRVDTLFVTDMNNVLQGLVDFEAINKNRQKASTVQDIVSHVYYVKSGTLLSSVADKMLKRGYKNIPVVSEEGKLEGLVTRASLVDIVYDTIWGDDEEVESIPLETTQFSESE
ncbi:betaine/proline/choline family ABC transporter ATP-binding protein [Alkalibacterium pelagium]|jgi:osmoprotectant transport system ATP-binding protein|uniref:Quaternary amine transport ATP-binding protein n=1 Tax=Alkalibacterium pelagium TaxID=426702 RepID=A0A1H7GM44_9LACT|nr:betaine/proline/choline family ABC transporter ATP-binding protein [Alkalibacterium pelagium]GEN49786.1 glycine/betaine ABC transporter ATP-binding protein [Alkalibacterium pelagium]SEK38052.1 osmoprotectant transport system ATP-binding protein [Alkalibacterium pelagium]